MGLTGPLAGRLSIRFGPEGLVVAGSWLILLSTAAFVGLGAEPNYAVLTFGLVVAGVGLGVGSPGTVAAVSAQVGPELLGTVSALMTLTATLANALGMAGLFAVVESTGGVHEPRAYRTAHWSEQASPSGCRRGVRPSAQRALPCAGPSVRSSIPTPKPPLDVTNKRRARREVVVSDTRE